MIGVLSGIIWLGGFICLILVVIKMYQRKGLLHAILGFICSLYAFIWGWINADREGIKLIMLVWTPLFILGFILGWRGYLYR